MVYECIQDLKIKRGFLWWLGLWNFKVGDNISIDRYNSLKDQEKEHFKQSYSDESIADQIERNLEK